MTRYKALLVLPLPDACRRAGALYALTEHPAAGPFEVTAGVNRLRRQGMPGWWPCIPAGTSGPRQGPAIVGLVAFTAVLNLRIPWFGFVHVLVLPVCQPATWPVPGAGWAFVATSVAFGIAQVGGIPSVDRARLVNCCCSSAWTWLSPVLCPVGREVGAADDLASG